VVGAAGGALSDEVSTRIERARGGGSPLGGATRSRMESAIGGNLGSVRIHHDEESDRRRVWERALGGAPQQDLDLDFVAAKFDLTGGSIRLAALSAAFLAAARGAPVGMVEVLQAIRGELTKLRRRPSDDQFGRWLPELQAAEPSEQRVRFGAS
jgi:hypothetical protein